MYASFSQNQHSSVMRNDQPEWDTNSECYYMPVIYSQAVNLFKKLHFF